MLANGGYLYVRHPRPLAPPIGPAALGPPSVLPGLRTAGRPSPGPRPRYDGLVEDRGAGGAIDRTKKKMDAPRLVSDAGP